MKSKYTIYNSSSQKMKSVRSETVDLVFTSPPYWDLKNYDIEGQIGYKQAYQDYLDDIRKVWLECYRVLRSDSVMCININSRIDKGEYYPIHIDFYKQLKEIGFKKFEMYIWHKASGVPAPKNKLTDRFEYVIVASKSKIHKNNFAYNDYKNKDMANINSWHIIKKAGSILKNHPHPAFYPVALVERGIELFTKENSTILDPFLGIGSTMLAAFNTGRNCIGFEINPVYIKTFIQTKPDDLQAEIL